MDSDFRRPQRNNKEPLDTHIPQPDNYETPSPDIAEAMEHMSAQGAPIQDIVTPSSTAPKQQNTHGETPPVASATPVAGTPARPDRRPSRRRLPRVAPASQSASGEKTSDQPDTNAPSSQSKGTPDGSRPKKPAVWKWVVGALVVLLAIAAIAGFMGHRWYISNLDPVEPNSTESARITIPEGYTSQQISELLDEAGLIKDVRAFNLYYRLNAGDGMKAGVYVIDRNKAVPEIVSKLESGDIDEFTVTFLPGGTIFDAKEVMINLGYPEEEVEAALYADYDSPIMRDRPVGSSIEGYIYGETYNVFSGASAQDVFARAIQELEAYMVENDTEARFAEMGLNIHEGLSFASLVQTEVRNADEMRQVSSVFHNRLEIDMSLGSDVTFRYAAKMLDQPVAIDIDSPYNTRIHKGLPPGPIAAPGAQAIEATVNPDPTEYLFFVSGDDGITYFSTTNEEHEALTRQHCDANCAVVM